VSRGPAANGALAPAGYPAAPDAEIDDRARPRSIVASTYRPRDYLLRRALAAADIAGIVSAAVLTLAVVPVREPWPGILLLLTMLPAWMVLFRLYGLYERDVKRVSLSVLDDLPALFHAFLVGTLLLWGYIELLGYQQGPGLRGAAVFGVVGVISVSFSRLVARRMFIHIVGPSRALLVVGSDLGTMLVRKMRDHPSYGLEPVGEVTVDGVSSTGIRPLGALGDVDLTALARELRIDRVIVAAPGLDDEAMMELVGDCGAAEAKVSILPGHVDALGPSLEVDDIEGMTLLGLNPLVLAPTSRAMKRTLDVVGSGLGLLLLAPLLAVAALAVRLDTPGPALFRQRRIGREGRPFTLLKFRTMVVDAEASTEELRVGSGDPDWLKIEHDPRVTRVGRILRRASIDELPQLWNVIRGEMSLVGPRPLIGSEDSLVSGWERTRLALLPGVTGMWQVLGRTDIPFREMLKLDCLYVTNWSLWLDIKLIARTVPAVLARRGVN
jgi:exopolysaccharide biosynthesis polyprenyl glycosylphosphotransferase